MVASRINRNWAVFTDGGEVLKMTRAEYQNIITLGTGQEPQLAATDYVLTGPPNSGKTTLIKGLAAMGHVTLHEVATELLREGISFMDQPEFFEEEKFRRQLRYEQGLPFAQQAFLDRGLFDTIAYHRAYSSPLPTYITDAMEPRYRLCFLLESCPWAEDGIRYEAQGDLKKAAEFSALISPLLEQAYVDCGIRVVRVPLMPVEERVQFIVEHCRQASEKRVSERPREGHFEWATYSPGMTAAIGRRELVHANQ